MNAIDIIKQDHQKVRDLFSQFTSASEEDLDRREDVFQDIEKELLMHTEIEEQVFYPALRSEAPEVIQGAVEEHQKVKTILSEMLAFEVDDEEFDTRMHQLMESVEHHVHEEEQPGGILELARQKFDSKNLDDLGRRMESLKRSEEDEIAA